MADKLSFAMPDANTSVVPPIRSQFAEMVVTSVPLNLIKPFHNHPYGVRDDQEMAELVESILDHGVQEPITLREMNGYYELLSGHRRRRATELAGLTSIPAIVRNLDDDEAAIYMVDANNQREHFLPSEKAKAYRIKMEALKHQGKRNGATDSDIVSWSAAQIAKDAKISTRQVYRYVRLSNLIDRFLEMIDNKEEKVQPNPQDMVFVMPMNVGLVLADLTEEQQYLLFDCICKTGRVPSSSQAMDLRDRAITDTLTEDFVSSVLTEKEKAPAEPPFEQDFIDTVLLSWYSKHFEKLYKTKPRADFIKSVTREYRNRCSFGDGIGIDGQSDGLHIRKQDTKMRLTWTKVANRIGELIEQGKYVDPHKKTTEVSALATENPEEKADSKLCDTVSQSDLQTENPDKPLRQLRSRKEREAFLESYERWGVWKEIPELRVRFYKYDLPNGARIIAQTYVHPPVSYYANRQEEYTVAEYALILPKDDDYKGAYGQEYTFYRPNGASKSVIIDYLTQRKPLVQFEYDDGNGVSE